MAFTLELEEWVGSAWHRFIARRASVDFPHARVDLVDRQRSLAVLFRALGGASGIALEAASERDLLLRRNLLMRIAGTCKHAASCDGNRLHLPSSLAVYPTVALNLELYRWLALLAAHAGPMTHWARDNQRCTWTCRPQTSMTSPSARASSCPSGTTANNACNLVSSICN
ncbi:nitric oxide reductase activation protein [Pseudomonas sp. BIGb0381]|nr:nitric oxide reductase activation protein [Pseudomonas sp. BIGb0381]